MSRSLERRKPEEAVLEGVQAQFERRGLEIPPQLSLDLARERYEQISTGSIHTEFDYPAIIAIRRITDELEIYTKSSSSPIIESAPQYIPPKQSLFLRLKERFVTRRLKQEQETINSNL